MSRRIGNNKNNEFECQNILVTKKNEFECQNVLV